MMVLLFIIMAVGVIVRGCPLSGPGSVLGTDVAGLF